MNDGAHRATPKTWYFSNNGGKPKIIFRLRLGLPFSNAVMSGRTVRRAPVVKDRTVATSCHLLALRQRD
jgi:hypothetical protein